VTVTGVYWQTVSPLTTRTQQTKVNLGRVPICTALFYEFRSDHRQTSGRASTAVQLERVNRSFYPWSVSFQVMFTDVNGNPANPGTFQVDIQTSTSIRTRSTAS
jgi:hypothetical protein